MKANPRVKNHYMLRAKADVITALDGRSKPGRARFFCYAAYKVPGEAICLMPSAGDRSLTKVRSFPSRKEALASAKKQLERHRKRVIRELKLAMKAATYDT